MPSAEEASNFRISVSWSCIKSVYIACPNRPNQARIDKIGF